MPAPLEPGGPLPDESHGVLRHARSPRNTIRVMIVESDAVQRIRINKWIREAAGLDIVARAKNGAEAVQALASADPDFVLLDIEMPVMTGLEALPELLNRQPNLAIVMASKDTSRGAKLAMNALSKGALDFVTKPSDASLEALDTFRKELILRARTFGGRVAGRRRAPSGPSPPLTSFSPAIRKFSPGPKRPSVPANPIARTQQNGSIESNLRKQRVIRTRIVAIGASTGGPQALATLFRDLGPLIDSVPVLITQHVPQDFAPILAGHIAKIADRPTAVGSQDMPVVPGQIYLAPGDRHMEISPAPRGEVRIVLTDAPPSNFCRPAVDPLFTSTARTFPAAALGIVLTGMGNDGAAGALALADSGSNVIAQDEASSVVWGMPQAALATGACYALLPLASIAEEAIGVVQLNRAARERARRVP